MSEDRSKFIGGSDVAAILGLSPWRTALSVWEEKTGMVDAEFDPEREKRLKRGNRLEPVIIELLQEERDVFVVERNARRFHPAHPFLSCQIDYEYAIGCSWERNEFLGEPGNGEVKSVDPRAAHEWGEDGSQDVPAHYMAQVQFGLAVTGRSGATIAALIGDDLRVYRFERDEQLCAALIDKAVSFWNDHVLTKIPPPPQDKVDAAKLVRRFAGFSFEASEDLQSEISNLRQAKAELKRWSKEAEAAELAILQKVVVSAEVLGDGTAPDKITVLAGGKQALTWNLQKRSSYVVKESDFRVLRLSK